MIYFMNIGLALMVAITLALLAPRRIRGALTAIMVIMVVGVFSWATWLDAGNGYVDAALHSNWDGFGRSLACGYAVVALRMAMSTALHYYS